MRLESLARLIAFQLQCALGSQENSAVLEINNEPRTTWFILIISSLFSVAKALTRNTMHNFHVWFMRL